MGGFGVALSRNIWLWVNTNGTMLGVGAPPILEPILVGIGMFTGIRDFDPWPYGPQLVFVTLLSQASGFLAL